MINFDLDFDSASGAEEQKKPKRDLPRFRSANVRNWSA